MADQSPKGWVVEQGIGEERALLYRKGHVVAARMRWPGALEPGAVLDGVLVAKPKGSSRGRARFASGEEALVDRLPRDASEGASMRFRITRAAVGETNRVKLAQARPTDRDRRPAPTLAESLPGAKVVRCFTHDDWEEVRDLAVDGIVTFAGGSLHFAPTPAMVVVDVDGHLPPRELALAAVEPLARAIAVFGLGGMIGVDFPTLETKADRKAVDEMLESALADCDHERTAMNGFGFVQLVARFERPSMLHLLQHDPIGAAARLLLRRAEALGGGGGVIELNAHPAVLARLNEGWLAELQRRTGTELSMKSDPALAREAANAQLVTR